jgi:hypothetical protein
MSVSAILSDYSVARRPLTDGRGSNQAFLGGPSTSPFGRMMSQLNPDTSVSLWDREVPYVR